MIATSKFVFLHLHKSGGTFINEFLRRFFPAAKSIGYHYPASALPREYADLPRFGLVRNPWSFYVSWFHFQKQKPRPDPIFRLTAGDPANFADTVRRVLTLGEDRQLLGQVRALLPADLIPSPSASLELSRSAREAIGPNLTKGSLDALEASEARSVGYYTYLFQWMYGDLHHTTIARLASVGPEFVQFLDAVGERVTDDMRAYLRANVPINRSSHGHFADYYDDDLAGLVAEKDAHVVDTYRFAL
ncbi:MAG: hypothetical protein MJE77_12330 [Proteobacteria bacterium]|nr:hypothetical protein [Pseudomonadota bacterium]